MHNQFHYCSSNGLIYTINYKEQLETDIPLSNKRGIGRIGSWLYMERYLMEKIFRAIFEKWHLETIN